MSEKIYTIEEIKKIVTPIARKHRITRMYLFGSYARGEADADSDIDIRIDAANLRTLFEMGDLYADLEEALNKSLDLVTTESLRENINDPLTRKFIRTIKKEEHLLYEEFAAS